MLSVGSGAMSGRNGTGVGGPCREALSSVTRTTRFSRSSARVDDVAVVSAAAQALSIDFNSRRSWRRGCNGGGEVNDGKGKTTARISYGRPGMALF